MSERTFDRETLLDLTVNIVPLGIIVFFFVVFLIADPWNFDPFIEFVSIGLLIIPFAALALLTFVSGRAIEQDEEADARVTGLNPSSESSIGSEETADDANGEVTALNDGSDADEDGADDEAEDSTDEHTADAESDEDDSTDTDEDNSAETDEDR